MGPLTPLFWTSGDVCPGFWSQSVSLFACFLTCAILRFTSSVTPVDCIEVSISIGGGSGQALNSWPSVWWAQHCIPLGHSSLASKLFLNYLQKVLAFGHSVTYCRVLTALFTKSPVESFPVIQGFAWYYSIGMVQSHEGREWLWACMLSRDCSGQWLGELRCKY